MLPLGEQKKTHMLRPKGINTGRGFHFSCFTQQTILLDFTLSLLTTEIGPSLSLTVNTKKERHSNSSKPQERYFGNFLILNLHYQELFSQEN